MWSAWALVDAAALSHCDHICGFQKYGARKILKRWCLQSNMPHNMT